MPILVYTPKFSPRIKYAFNLLLVEVLGADELQFATNKKDFKQFEGTRINYSTYAIEGALQFVPAGILNEHDIAEQEIVVSRHKDIPVFFGVSNSILPFDPFAAAFYLASRYEEYLPFIGDAHNRFPAEESLAYKEDFLHLPVVNIWAQLVKEELLKAFPDQKFYPQPYAFLSTIDVDNLYAYRGKGAFRTGAAAARDVLTFQFKELFNRLQTLTGFAADPFDTFDEQMAIRDEAGVNTLYFMLFAEFARFDRNVSMYSPKMQERVRHMLDVTAIGIHPSYRSNESEKIVAHEIRSLENALRKPITQSRQHFLKMRMPDTFRILTDLGITDEYSMGYASNPGFRAGLATPFTFYDLDMEEALPLRMHPFMVMDVTFIDYFKTEPETALQRMKTFVDATRAVGGTFISVFHNRIFSEKEPEWQGWKNVYAELLAYAKP